MRPTVTEDIAFIKEELLPEMVHDRCFCESDSREFVEFDSAEVNVRTREAHHLDFAFYSARVVVLFSGEPQVFHVLVKLLPEDCTLEPSLSLAYNGFLNEEILWNKGTLQFGKEYFPKFYAINMGKYGRPVVVIEDLEKNGYERVTERRLNEEEAVKVLQLIGDFHGKGLRMKVDKFTVYREFLAKFQEITFAELTEKELIGRINRYVSELREKAHDSLRNQVLDDNIYVECKTSSNREPCTICNNYLLRENLWFKRSPAGGKVEDVKILDWQRVRCGNNGLDLAVVISECELVDMGTDLLDVYSKAVQNNYPSVSEAELKEGIIEHGFGYELVVSVVGNRSVEDRMSIRGLCPFLG